MNILMITNSYTPHISGVEKSIMSFSEIFRERGHNVKIVAPETDEPVTDDKDVVRVTSIKNFNHTDYPVGLPMPGELDSLIEEFKPDIVHSHFPFFIGSSAARVAAAYNIPLVFTYHTMYERYIHYVSCDSERVRKFVTMLASGYCNLCDMVIAPSTGVKNILLEREVNVPIEVVPTGIKIQQFAKPSSPDVRSRYGIPDNAFVAGYTGRFTTEKNLEFLAEALSIVLSQKENAYFMMIGDGPLKETLEDLFESKGLKDRAVFTGKIQSDELTDAYHCMDVFTFTSKTETQGMVLAEAMAAGVPVVAIDGPGIDDIVKDGFNGFLINTDSPSEFADKVMELYDCDEETRRRFKKNAADTAEEFSIEKCADVILKKYREVISRESAPIKDPTLWTTAAELIKTEWDIFHNYLNALAEMLHPLDRREEV